MTMANSLDSFRPILFYFLTTRNPDDYTVAAVGTAMNAVKAAGFGSIVVFSTREPLNTILGHWTSSKGMCLPLRWLALPS